MEHQWATAPVPERTRPSRCIFRLGGIYGPGRSALDAVAKGRAAAEDDPRFVSRIHVNDICRVLEASMIRRGPGLSIYNVVDDLPTPKASTFALARQLLGVTKAGEAQQPTRRDRTRVSKRVSNRKIKADLDFELEFPNYEHGLRAIHRGDQSPFLH
mmetsp:Transcript_13175/g.26748  ORF Transcript_13175/g.26748 Transcript_13175/m.26748 type:complete len:157 (-) Transcript_13175:146-616(-)